MCEPRSVLNAQKGSGHSFSKLHLASYILQQNVSVVIPTYTSVIHSNMERIVEASPGRNSFKDLFQNELEFHIM